MKDDVPDDNGFGHDLDDRQHDHHEEQGEPDNEDELIIRNGRF